MKLDLFYFLCFLSGFTFFIICSYQIAHFKTPRYVLFVSSYPLTVTGKVRTHMETNQVHFSVFVKMSKTRLV